MQTIGRYQLLAEVGRGASGVVYKALDPAIGRTIAIKIVDLERLPARERDTQRPRLEAQSLGRLQHQNIVMVFDIIEEPARSIILMEFVDGPSLDFLIEQNQLPPKRLVLDLLREAAAALDFAHSNGILHRDVKPANMLVHQGRTMKIADFGVAKLDQQNVTTTGLVMGTPTYMAPEQIGSGEMSGCTDQYALAVVAYELLTGQRPFKADTVQRLLFKIVQEEPAAALRLNPTIGVAADQVLRRGLAKDPKARYPTCTAFVDALITSLEGQGSWTLAPKDGQLAAADTTGAAVLDPQIAETRAAALETVAAPVLTGEETQLVEKRRSPWRVWLLAVLALAVVSSLAAILMPRNPAPAPPATPEPPPQAAAERPSAMPAEGNPPQPVAPAKPEEPAPAKPQASEPGETTPTKQHILITSNPVGARVSIDQDAVTCTTPCEVDLERGAHRMSASKDGYYPASQNFRLPGDSELSISLEASGGQLLIRSNPDGANILVNGQLRTEKTPARIRLAPGRYSVEIAKEGFARDVGEATVREGGITTIEAKLVPSQR